MLLIVLYRVVINVLLMRIVCSQLTPDGVLDGQSVYNIISVVCSYYESSSLFFLRLIFLILARLRRFAKICYPSSHWEAEVAEHTQS